MAGNTIITPTWNAREVARVASNATKFVGAITRKLSDDFIVSGTKVGATVGLRLPQRFITTKGQALQPQAIVDSIVPVTITDQANIGYGWSSFSETLELQDMYDRYVNPAGYQMANTMDKDGLFRCYQDVFNIEGTPAQIPNTNLTYLNAAARLTNFAVPDRPRKVFINSLMRAVIVNANLNLFNPPKEISELWTNAMFASAALSWDEWFEDVNTFPHVFGPQGGVPLTFGAGQTGPLLVTNGWTAVAALRLNKGDVFTIAGCFAINPQAYQSTTQLLQFVVTAPVSSDGAGNATIPIYPPIIPATTGNAYATCDVSPASGAALTLVGAAGAVSPQGLGFHPEAFVCASADLVLPRVGEAKRVRLPAMGVSMRYWQASDIMTDQHPSRLDVIYGFKTFRPEFAVRIAS
jgi:hypothetical protein